MITKYLSAAIIFITLCCILCVSGFQQVFVQVTGPQQIRWIRVGELHHWFSNGGAEVEYGRRGRIPSLFTDQIDGLNWPGEYTLNKGVNVGESMWIGTTNFDDPVAGKAFPYKVVCAGRQNMYLNSEIYPMEFSLVGKFVHPAVYVDNGPASYLESYDAPDKIDPTIPCDRMITNTVNTPIGITVKRRVLAFTQQYHDNYLVYEYTFVNTGITDNMGTSFNPPRTLTGVAFHFQYRFAFPGESFSGGWSPSTSSWGRNTINDCYDGKHAGSFRACWEYYGPLSSAPSLADDIGLPNYSNGSILAGTNFAGVVVLHADKSPQDHSDDPSQPITTQFMGSDQDAQTVSATSQYDDALMAKKYGFMTKGQPAKTHAEEIGKDSHGWPTGFANTWGGDAGGYSSAQGFGPYTLAPGDSVKIVVAQAVAGIMKDRDFVRTIANNWFNNSGPFVLPDGSTTTDRDIYKNAWVFTGKDSLFKTFQRAVANFNSGYAIPQPPPPPDRFEVTSGADEIALTWSNSAETWPHFNGYHIYRAEGRRDSTYERIFECDKDNIVHSFDDKTALQGFNYYYYIQTKDDGSTNDIEPGIPLVSSKFYTMMDTLPGHITGVAEYRADIPKDFSLNQNFPNPFNPTTTISFSLPKRSFISLKIFDLLGREVTTIVLEELSAGNHSREWNANGLPSCVYFYRLQAGSFTETKKLLLLR